MRGAAKKSENNQTVIIDINQILKQRRPKLPNKNKAGAPKGNRNAVTTGLHTKESRVQMQAVRAATRRMVAELKLCAALVRAKAAQKDAETFARLRRAGLSPRVLWPSEWR
jgi:hypothetical protein